MNKIKLFLFGLLLSFGFAQEALAHIGPRDKGVSKQKKNVRFRGGDCAAATKQIDQDINNVRARLLNGGDVWWDTDDGRYIVPKVVAGQPEVSSLFAGAVWIGGLDPGGNLKLAAKAYGSSNGTTDFYPGPLDQFTGGTDPATCNNWDRFFKVLATEIKEHLNLLAKQEKGEIVYTAEMIPAGVRGWPAKGNPHFVDVWGFELPATGQGLAGFFDGGSVPDGIYDPLDGDFPIVEIRNCTNFGPDKTVTDVCGNVTFLPGVDPQFPDEMIFWIYNDAGGTHTETNADPIQMEIQVQTFAYATNDFINNMTFQRYKLINRAVEDITNCYFAMWADPDLGCYTDDYIGCDTSRSLMYVYNQDAADGQTGTTCPGGVNTYGTNIPILGIDYFRGPRGNVPCYDGNGQAIIDTLTLDTVFTKVELGMSSFTYYNGAVGQWPQGTTDPQTAQEFYNYITGRWRDGSPFQFGDLGYNTGGEEIDYAFPSPPDCADASICWSMCTASLGEGDRRTLQATGPFTLKPGDVNELIVGVVWLPEQDYPCPDITELQKADDVAQSLFNNCFDITDGPDAPDVDWLELDRQVVGILTNDDEVSNNAKEAYEELDLNAPETLPEEERKYRFEGYKVFQLLDANVSVTELADPAKAVLVFQSDVDNEIGLIYNWEAVDNPNPSDPDIWVPEEQVLVPNPNGGVRHTFSISEDRFTQSTDTRLINHKKYYYLALAYAHNNYDDFDPFASGGVGSGQTKSYLEGRGNIKTYTVIPRPLTYEVLAAEYGESVPITRLAGEGAGSHFLDVTAESREAAFDTDNFDGTLTYKENRGPFDVVIFNPLDVQDGKYQLTLEDTDNMDEVLDASSEVTWRLTNIETNEEIVSVGNIASLNEQIIPEFGFSIAVKDGLIPGNNAGGTGDPNNGAVGYEEEYADDTAPQWFSGIPAGFAPPGVGAAAGIFDYMSTGANEPDNALDPTEAYSSLGSGFFVPYILADYRTRTIPYITPVWTDQGGLVRQSMRIENLNNVDIVFTSDKSKWSRCIVVESTLPTVSAFGFTTQSPDGEDARNHFDTRGAPSVGKEDADGDGMPDPDGDGNGMGWFPGYAIDVETGQRLNLFFGEASIYRCDEPFFDGFLQACDGGVFDDNNPTGADMMWNPTSQGLIANAPQGSEGIWQAITGGMHFIYLTRQPYDGCEALRDQLRPGINPLFKARAFGDVTWAGYPITAAGTELLSYADGLIPNDLVVKLRVDNPFAYNATTVEENGHPTYEFEIAGKEKRAIADDTEVNEALDKINIVPNPYYGFSPYETSQFATTVKITNLPAQCEVTIYTLDGKFIRNYKRDESGTIPEGSNRAIDQAQITPALEWDLRNNKLIPVASGVYLIHVNSPEYGERVLKWFGIARQYDPSGL